MELLKLFWMDFVPITYGLVLMSAVLCIAFYWPHKPTAVWFIGWLLVAIAFPIVRKSQYGFYHGITYFISWGFIYFCIKNKEKENEL